MRLHLPLVLITALTLNGTAMDANPTNSLRDYSKPIEYELAKTLKVDNNSISPCAFSPSKLNSIRIDISNNVNNWDQKRFNKRNSKTSFAVKLTHSALKSALKSAIFGYIKTDEYTPLLIEEGSLIENFMMSFPNIKNIIIVASQSRWIDLKTDIETLILLNRLKECQYNIYIEALEGS